VTEGVLRIATRFFPLVWDISGLPVTRHVNSELECEIYIGVGFDALARDRKPSVLLAHKQYSKTLAGMTCELVFRTDKCAAPSESRTT